MYPDRGNNPTVLTSSLYSVTLSESGSCRPVSSSKRGPCAGKQPTANENRNAATMRELPTGLVPRQLSRLAAPYQKAACRLPSETATANLTPAISRARVLVRRSAAVVRRLPIIGQHLGSIGGSSAITAGKRICTEIKVGHVQHRRSRQSPPQIDNEQRSGEQANPSAKVNAALLHLPPHFRQIHNHVPALFFHGHRPGGRTEVHRVASQYGPQSPSSVTRAPGPPGLTR